MAKLYFIRHGQTEANINGILTGRLETDLSEKGIDDAKELSLSLNEKFDYYYCSPLRRTKQTLIALRGNVEYMVDDRLTEVNSGDWQGKYKKELPKDEYELYKNGLLTPPKGETMLEVDTRIKSFLHDIFSRHNKNDKILIVTHNAFMRNLKRLFLDSDKVLEPKNLEIFMVDENMYNKFIQREI